MGGGGGLVVGECFFDIDGCRLALLHLPGLCLFQQVVYGHGMFFLNGALSSQRKATRESAILGAI